eukprot:EG_transcript_17463
MPGEVITEVASVAAKKIHVSNLPPGATEQQLVEIFAPCGPMSFVRIFTNPNEHTFAFVEFMEVGAARAAFALQGINLGGCQLRISTVAHAVHAQPYIKRDRGLLRKLEKLNNKLEGRKVEDSESEKSRSPSPKSRPQKSASPLAIAARPGLSAPAKFSGTVCKDGTAFIPFRSSQVPATPWEHLQCVRRTLLRNNPSCVLKEDGIIINIDKAARKAYADGKVVTAVVEVEGVQDAAQLRVPTTASFVSVDNSSHTVLFPTAQAYAEFDAAVQAAGGQMAKQRGRSKQRSRSPGPSCSESRNRRHRSKSQSRSRPRSPARSRRAPAYDRRRRSPTRSRGRDRRDVGPSRRPPPSSGRPHPYDRRR